MVSIARRIVVLVAVVALTLLVGAGRPPQAMTFEAGATCPGTRPTHRVPPGAGLGRAGFNFGGPYLRAHIGWRSGTLTAGVLPDGGATATIDEDGSIHLKQGWWRGLSGPLVITGRRLDAYAPPLRVEMSLASYGNRGFVPAGLVFPTGGCWRVEGRLASARLTYTVRIVKLQH